VYSRYSSLVRVIFFKYFLLKNLLEEIKSIKLQAQNQYTNKELTRTEIKKANLSTITTENKNKIP
jgi:uncharacterized membrane protein YciS (DUF1049 family)